MATEQLLEKSSVRTDRFSITGFVMFTTQGTVKLKVKFTLAQNTKAQSGSPIHVLFS